MFQILFVIKFGSLTLRSTMFLVNKRQLLLNVRRITLHKKTREQIFFFFCILIYDPLICTPFTVFSYFWTVLLSITFSNRYMCKVYVCLCSYGKSSFGKQCIYEKKKSPMGHVQNCKKYTLSCPVKLFLWHFCVVK